MINKNGKGLLIVGQSFVFKGNYCTVTKLYKNSFKYDVQGDRRKINHYMTYDFYKTTPSYYGRNLENRRKKRSVDTRLAILLRLLSKS
jgi:hypothetical protein